jgi:hypothetical protein
MFVLAEIVSLLRNNKELANALNQIKDHVHKRIKNNEYGIVNLTELFKYC